MAEYIEREALLGSIGLTQLHFVAHGDNKSLYDIINEQPAADVAPKVNDAEGGRDGGLGHVVRCKECKHEEECMKQLVFWERDHVLEQNVYQYHKLDFCSFGERRADNEN